MSSGDVLVRALYSGISRGTEALVFHGRRAGERVRAHARAVSGGSFPAPVKYGYASVGEVERGPADARGTSRVRAPSAPDAVRRPGDAVHVLPPELPPARAVLAANMETAINGLWDAAPRIGDRITVIGARHDRLSRRVACGADRRL